MRVGYIDHLDALYTKGYTGFDPERYTRYNGQCEGRCIVDVRCQGAVTKTGRDVTHMNGNMKYEDRVTYEKREDITEPYSSDRFGISHDEPVSRLYTNQRQSTAIPVLGPISAF